MTIVFCILIPIVAIAMPIFVYRTEKRMAEATKRLNCDDEEEKKIGFVDLISKGRVIISMLAVFVASIAHMVALLMPQGLARQILVSVLLAADVGFFAYICILWYWHHEADDEGRQFVPLVVVIVCTTVLSWSATWMVIDAFKIGTPFDALLYTTMVVMPPIFAAGYCIARIFLYRAHEAQDADTKTYWRKRGKISLIVTAVALALVFLLGFLPALIPSIGALAQKNANDSDLDTETTGASPRTASGSTSSHWYSFYNDVLQMDEDEENDFNFGPDPYKKGISAKELDRESRSRDMVDIPKAVGEASWVNELCGTRFLIDKFYDEYAEQDDAAINAAKDFYMQDGNEKLYKDALSAYFTFLDTAVVEVREIEEPVEDQMYMIPSRMSIRGVPDVAVFKTTQQGGHYLVYVFSIKGETVEVPFRVECGFQPTNVAKRMNVTVQEKPSTSGGVGGKDPDVQTNPTEKPSPSPTTEPRYNKDKSLSDNSGTNDNPGEGKSTNNGYGAKDSAEDVNGGNGTPRNDYDEGQRHEADNASANTSSTPSHDGGGGTIDNAGGSDDRPSSTPKDPEIANDVGNPHWNTSGV